MVKTHEAETMPDEMAVSVVIPVYNRTDGANAAISSVLAQTDLSLELIIVDDGSKPPFELIATIRSDPRVTLVRHQENSGPAAARKTGILAATNPWIAFLDSDDLMVRDTLAARLRTAIEFYEENSRDDVMIVGCGWIAQDQSGKSLIRRVPNSAREVADYFAGCWFAPGSAIIARTKYLRDNLNKLDLGLWRLEDLDWFAELALVGMRLKIDPRIGVRITRFSKPDAEFERAAVRLITKWTSAFEGERIDSRELNNMRAYIALERTALHWKTKRVTSALFHLVSSLWYRPRLHLQLSPGWQETSVKDEEIV